MWRLRTLLLPLLLCMICATVYSHNTLQEQRNGLQDGGTYGLVDNLTYTYNGNQLTKISDSVEDPTYVGAFNFRDGADSSAEYTYDAVGNMTSDKNKGITSITYNVINQPQKITFYDGKTTEYVYSYDGTKLQTVHKTLQPQTSTTTTYCVNIIYENGALKQMLVDGGYVTFSGATPVYHFYIQDHLGNNRVVAKADGTVEQINHYYPYGGLMADICTGSDVQPYKYNGKELDRMHGLDTYDYGARQHNAATGRWDRIDRKCEKYYDFSPYAYCGGNPINRIDLHGDSIAILDKVSIDAIYNALQPGTNLSMKFNNGILIPESIQQIASSSQDSFLQDLYNISINSQMVEIATTNTNDYYIGDEFHSDIWSAPSDIDYAKDFNNGQKTELYPAGRTILGNLGQTLYPISSSEYKRATNGNIRININAMGNINQRSCSIAHEFGHVILYLNGQPHGHSNNSDFIFGRQWNVMKRFGYDYLESLTGKIFK